MSDCDSSSDDTLQSNVDELKQSLFCAICTDQFYRPMTLLCQHTFCNSCLEKVNEKKCPICKVNFTLPREYNRILDMMVKTFFHETWEERDAEYKQFIARRTIEETVRNEIRNDVFNEVVAESVSGINEIVDTPAATEPSSHTVTEYVAMVLDGHIGTLVHQWLDSPINHISSIGLMNIISGVVSFAVFLMMLLPTIIPGSIFVGLYLLFSLIVAYSVGVLRDITEHRQNLIAENTRNMMLMQMRNQPPMEIYADNRRLG